MRRGAEMIRKSIIDRLNAGVAETEYPDEGIETAELNMIEAAALIGDLTEMCERLYLFASAYADKSAIEAGHGLLESAKALILEAKGE